MGYGTVDMDLKRTLAFLAGLLDLPQSLASFGGVANPL